MASYNRVILIGNLTRDVELRYTPSNLAVTDIGLAVNDRRKGPNGDWIEETTFVDVTLWGRQAEIASQYLTKGSQCLIEGRLKLDTWEKDGKKNSKLKVIGENMRMLGGKGAGAGGGGGGGGAPAGGGGPSRGQSGGARTSQPASTNQKSYDEGGGDSYGGGESYGDSGGGGSGEDIPF
jgi:single-strand DNA-binding protein